MPEATHQTETTPAGDRRSGILLHPTSLPGPWGIGDLGPTAYRFVDLLESAGQRLWQILPLGPTTAGSPYSTVSAAAGNPWLIDIESVYREAGHHAQLVDPTARVDFAAVEQRKGAELLKAFDQFQTDAAALEEFDAFCQEQREWLDDYALFMTIREQFDGRSWNQWPKPLATRQTDELNQVRKEFEQRMRFHEFVQFVFFKQWMTLRRYANQRAIRIVGDIPFYVALDSADVWAHPQNFELDLETGEALWMGGVPPDCFSETGQLWNTPIYNWRHLEATGFRWWVERFRQLSQLVDIVRIDHFRGFAAYWQVRGGDTTAINGQWIDAPGDALFTTVGKECGNLPIWAEDLGLITADVGQLRDRFSFPGMKVLQFAFDSHDPQNPHLPENYVNNCVCYTGTHDNHTTRGWWQELNEPTREFVSNVIGLSEGEPIQWALIRFAMNSPARDVVLPWQDVLGLTDDARFNVPGSVNAENWTWRYDPADVRPEGLEHLKQLTRETGR